MKWLGIDISKRKFDLALLDAGKVRSKVFENMPAGYEALLSWLTARGHKLEELHACMEATSVYDEKLATFLHDAGIRVSVVNPLQIKAFGESLRTRQKTDRADAARIVRFAQQQGPVLWQPAPREVRELQRLRSWLEAVQHMRVQEQNRDHESRRRHLGIGPAHSGPTGGGRNQIAADDPGSHGPASAVA